MEGNTEFQEPQKPQQGSLNPETQSLQVADKGFLKRLKRKFDGVFRSEKKIGGHNISFKVFHNKHRSAEETKNIEELFQDADIFIPELFGWTKDYLNDLRKLSSGEVTPEDILRKMGEKNPLYRSREESFFNLIYNTQKPITIIDVPEGHPLDVREREIVFPKIQFGKSFSQSLDSVRQYIIEFADLQKEREAYMFGQLEPRIQELININPQLGSKHEINVLLSIGGAHTQLSNKLKNKYQKTKEFEAVPRLFLYKEEAMIIYMYEKSVDDELAARVFSEQLLSRAHKKLFITEDSVEDVRSVRKLISRFNFDEMKKMFEESGNLSEWADSFVQRSREKQKVANVSPFAKGGFDLVK